MPLSVLIRSGTLEQGESPPLLTFDGARVAIGRGMGCEVRLPDPSVSLRHASIRTEGAEYTLVDEGSTNGTFVGGIRLSPFTPRALRSGDLVRVGRVWLEVRADQRPPTADLASATRDLALSLVAHAMAKMGDDVLTKIRVVEGPDLGVALPLAEEGRAYLVGRGEGCDLPLEDMDASRDHAQIVRRGNTVLVRDLGAKNGVLLGESRLPAGRDMAWRNPAMLRIGGTVLALEEPVLAALAELEQAQDEPMDANVLPPPPSLGPGASPSSFPKGAQPTAMGDVSPGAGPLAEIVADGRARPPKKRRASLSGADIAVIVAALGVIAISVAGLYWLLRG
jgi:pSer/pThr/pTyr-binding forkhead associated (FHA) protein